MPGGEDGMESRRRRGFRSINGLIYSENGLWDGVTRGKGKLQEVRAVSRKKSPRRTCNAIRKLQRAASASRSGNGDAKSSFQTLDVNETGPVFTSNRRGRAHSDSIVRRKTAMMLMNNSGLNLSRFKASAVRHGASHALGGAQEFKPGMAVVLTKNHKHAKSVGRILSLKNPRLPSWNIQLTSGAVTFSGEANMEIFDAQTKMANINRRRNRESKKHPLPTTPASPETPAVLPETPPAENPKKPHLPKLRLRHSMPMTPDRVRGLHRHHKRRNPTGIEGKLHKLEKTSYSSTEGQAGRAKDVSPKSRLRGIKIKEPSPTRHVAHRAGPRSPERSRSGRSPERSRPRRSRSRSEGEPKSSKKKGFKKIS